MTTEREYTVQEVADLQRVHKATIERAIKARRIRIERRSGAPMGNITITQAALDEFREANTQRRAAA
jgi:excisionase family DNA binding protein